MAARVSHDLRMPLTALNASLELLADATEGSIDPTVALLVNSSRRSVDRMSGPGRRPDATARAHPGAARPSVELEGVARRVGADLGPLFEGAGATVRIGSLPTVRADPDLMYSVLLNLVSNAVKFARTGAAARSPRSRVNALRAGLADQRPWTTAPACRSSNRDAVFGMFTRLTDAPGHGIGLTTVAQIVRAHGGTVGIADPGRAGRPEFWFVLQD